MGDRIVMNEVNAISRIEGLELLNSQTVNRKNLLVKLDGETLHITQRSWFSMGPSPKKIFDEVRALSEADCDLSICRDIKSVRNMLVHQAESVKPLSNSKKAGSEGFIKKIIRFISEYFGWRLSQNEYKKIHQNLTNILNKTYLNIFKDMCCKYMSNNPPQISTTKKGVIVSFDTEILRDHFLKYIGDCGLLTQDQFFQIQLSWADIRLIEYYSQKPKT